MSTAANRNWIPSLGQRRGLGEFVLLGLFALPIAAGWENVDVEASAAEPTDVTSSPDPSESDWSSSVVFPIVTALVAASSALAGTWLSSRSASGLASQQHRAATREAILRQMDLDLNALLEAVSRVAQAATALVHAGSSTASAEAQEQLRGSVIELELRRAPIQPWMLKPEILDGFVAAATSVLRRPTSESLEGLGKAASDAARQVGISFDQILRQRDAEIVRLMQDSR